MNLPNVKVPKLIYNFKIVKILSKFNDFTRTKLPWFIQKYRFFPNVLILDFQLLTIDPTLEQLGLPAYPPLPADTDQAKVEEIRRTVYVGNLPKNIDGQKVLDFFNCYVGEVSLLALGSWFFLKKKNEDRREH